jgi:hypothetical protein
LIIKENALYSSFEFPREIFDKYSDIKFFENSSVAAKLLHADTGQKGRETDITKIIVTLCNFANAPKNEQNILVNELNKN